MSNRFSWQVVSGRDARQGLQWWTDSTETVLQSLTGYTFELDLRPLGKPTAAIVRTISTALGTAVVSSITDGTPPATVAAALTLAINDEDAALPVGTYEGWLIQTSGAESIPVLHITLEVST
jgi:hypothetical protein